MKFRSKKLLVTGGAGFIGSNFILYLLEKYDDLEPDMDFLNEYSKRNNNLDFAGKIRLDADNDATFAFGKYTGQKVVDVFKIDLGYYSWIMKGDFPEYTKKIFTNLKLSLTNSK